MAAKPNAPRRPHQLTCPQIVSRDRGSVVIEINTHPVEHNFQGVLTVAAKGLQSDRIVHGLEQQPCGVQVVEWVGLIF